MIQRGTVAIVLAAGTGKRMNTAQKKQYISLKGYPILYYSLKAFEESQIERIVLVTGEEELSYCQNEIVKKYGFQKVTAVVAGGKERYHSVYNGLMAAKGPDYVLIHDGARPFVTQDIIMRTLDGARAWGACVAGMPAKDTIKIADKDGFAKDTPDRSKVWVVQTPQSFSYDLILPAYQNLIEMEQNGHTVTVTDDAMVLELFGCNKVKLAEGSYDNIKITTPSDLSVAENIIRMRLNMEIK